MAPEREMAMKVHVTVEAQGNITPDQQTAESCKYVCTQFCAVPHPDGSFSLFWSYGQHRQFQGTFSPEEFLDRLRTDFAKQEDAYNYRKAREEAARQRSQSTLDLDIPLDLGLNDLDLEFKL